MKKLTLITLLSIGAAQASFAQTALTATSVSPSSPNEITAADSIQFVEIGIIDETGLDVVSETVIVGDQLLSIDEFVKVVDAQFRFTETINGTPTVRTFRELIDNAPIADRRDVIASAIKAILSSFTSSLPKDVVKSAAGNDELDMDKKLELADVFKTAYSAGVPLEVIIDGALAGGLSLEQTKSLALQHTNATEEDFKKALNEIKWEVTTVEKSSIKAKDVGIGQ